MTLPVLRVALEHGAVLSAGMTAIIVASLWQDPRIWQGDAPKAMQDLLGPPPPETAARKRFWSVLALIVMIGAFGTLLWRLPGVEGGDTFMARWLAAYVAFQVFNLVDATVIDVGLLLVWAPAWAFAPGTRHHPALRDPGFHARNYAVGVLAGVPFALFWALLGLLDPR